MTWSTPLAKFVSADMERVRILQTFHAETVAERPVTVSQCVYRNVFTDFDVSLSRHMAAVSGRGFPTVTLVRSFLDAAKGEDWSEFETLALPALPDALAAAVERANRFGPDGALRVAGETGEETLRITEALVAALEDARTVAARLGDPAFVEMGGDFEALLVTPPCGGAPARLMITGDSVTLPTTAGDGLGFEAQLGTFEHCARNHLGARRYLAAARQEEIAAKAAAVAAFRAAAETRILDLDRTMQGRPLSGHRLEMVAGLIARLRAGLGPDLRGLAQHARITALDWAADVIDSGQVDAGVWAAE